MKKLQGQWKQRRAERTVVRLHHNRQEEVDHREEHEERVAVVEHETPERRDLLEFEQVEGVHRTKEVCVERLRQRGVLLQLSAEDDLPHDRVGQDGDKEDDKGPSGSARTDVYDRYFDW